MNNLFYLDDIEIEEPVGFEDIEFSIKRDDVFHGMSYEAATSPLQFYGLAAIYLKELKENLGVNAKVTFRALQTCENYDYEEVISGRLNFGKYKDVCGTECTVSIPLEQESCAIILNSRKEQKIDVDRDLSVNNIYSLNSYSALGVEVELPAHNLLEATEGYVSEDGDVINLNIFGNDTHHFVVRPTYSIEKDASINESELVPSVFAASDNGFNDEIISPVLLLDDNINCFDGNFSYQVRLKGSYNFTYNALIGGSDDIDNIYLKVAYGEYPDSLTNLHYQVLPFSDHTASGNFDYSYSGNLVLPQGKGFYVYFGFDGENPVSETLLSGTVTFDKETYVNISGVKSCPATNAELYLIHETLSRVTEAITNGCVRVKSSFYGRIDSQPFSFDTDGCGGLRSLTSGLKIRRAVEDKFFASLKELIEGLNAIDNIGYDIIPDSIGSIMRIEGLDFWYQDREILRHDGVPKGSTDVEENKHYSRIDVGYKKWEVRDIKGLDEFNSNRQYATSIDTINQPLDITSNLIAGSYPIEVTRQQSFADSGGADTSYDNDIFIICMQRSTYPYSYLYVEQGNITSPENIFSPSTIYNYRISPIRNLMRWYKTISAGSAQLSNAVNQLFFSSGTGNLIAKGLMTDTTCRKEKVAISENDNIFVTQFIDDYTPLWKPELLTYDYPMSIAEYRAIKDNPYGYVSVQCGNNEFKKYWIKEIKFKPMKGVAGFSLRRKYGD